ncbi:hypothetical protein E2C01_099587 [Portunus trituberculatus]|uniref:Uncharacterized protein n=1 Tax=Portunus trituberculatus TaxID=210409 RepID=A0A5B7KFC5_PORTR|nr:hypothetical protein [Portunus trituberculatus]
MEDDVIFFRRAFNTTSLTNANTEGKNLVITVFELYFGKARREGRKGEEKSGREEKASEEERKDEEEEKEEL